MLSVTLLFVVMSFRSFWHRDQVAFGKRERERERDCLYASHASVRLFCTYILYILFCFSWC